MVPIHHYEYVVLAIVGGDKVVAARSAWRRNGRAATCALTPLPRLDPAIEAVHSRNGVLCHKRGRAHVGD